MEPKTKDIPKDRIAIVPFLQASTCLEQEGESEVVRTGRAEEGAVERETAGDKTAVRAERKGAECRIVRGGRVRWGG